MIHVQIDCPASVEMVDFLDQISEWIIARYNRLESRKMVMAIHEAIINSVEAMKRRYGTDHTANHISMKMRLHTDQIEVMIIDTAGGLSVEVQEKMKQPDFHACLWEEDGRGLFIIHHLVDEVWHEQDEDGRFVMGLRKWLKQER